MFGQASIYLILFIAILYVEFSANVCSHKLLYLVLFIAIFWVEFSVRAAILLLFLLFFNSDSRFEDTRFTIFAFFLKLEISVGMYIS